MIGVADDRRIIGLAEDGFENMDKLMLHLVNLLRDRVKPNVLPLVDFDLLTIENKSVLSVRCKKGDVPVWLTTDTEHFYIRSGPTSTELSPSDAVDYIVGRFLRK